MPPRIKAICAKRACEGPSMKRLSFSRGLFSLANDVRGATAVEYGLILALVFLAIVAGVSTLGSSVRERWDDISDKVMSASSAA